MMLSSISLYRSIPVRPIAQHGWEGHCDFSGQSTGRQGYCAVEIIAQSQSYDTQVVLASEFTYGDGHTKNKRTWIMRQIPNGQKEPTGGGRMPLE